jgi:hypothetical protein
MEDDADVVGVGIIVLDMDDNMVGVGIIVLDMDDNMVGVGIIVLDDTDVYDVDGSCELDRNAFGIKETES